MRVDVQPIFELGRARPKSKRLLGPHSRGLLRVIEKRVNELGRIAMCANVVTVTDGMEQPVVPELVDAQLIWADDNRLRIRGNEVVENIVYGQTWDLTVL